MKLLFLAFIFTLAGALGAQEQYRGSIPVSLLRPGRGGEAPRYPTDTVIGEMGQGEASDAAYSFATWVAGGLLSGRMNHPALETINPLVREGYLQAIREAEPVFYRMGSGREEADGSTSFLIRFIGKEFAVTAEMYVRHATVRVNEPDELLEENSEEVSEWDASLEQPELPPEEGIASKLAAAAAEEEAALAAQDETAPDSLDNSDDDSALRAAEDIASKITPEMIATTTTWILEDLLLDEVKDREQEKKETLNRIDYVPYERFF